MWLILHSGIYFYILLNFGLLRVSPRILFGFLSSLDRLSIRRKAEKFSDEIFSKSQDLRQDGAMQMYGIRSQSMVAHQSTV